MKRPATIRGFSMPQVVAALAEVEKRLEIPAGRRRYVKLGYWLVERGHFRRLLGGLLRGMPRTYVPQFTLLPKRRAFSKLFRDWDFRGGMAADLGADAICIRNNVRAFYPGFSLKILLSKSRDVDNMRNDVAARARVLAHGTLRLPRILEWDCDGAFPFITEELVQGRRLHPRHDAEVVASIVGGPIWDTYRADGFRFAKIHEVMRMDDLRPLLESCCSSLEWEAEWPERKDWVESLAVALDDRVIVCSFGHGDLGYSNVLVQPDGAACILDWECAGEMPVMSDLLRLIMEVPAARAVVESRLDELAANHEAEGVSSFRTQLLAALADQLLQWARSWDGGKPAPRDEARLSGYIRLVNSLL